MHVPISKYIELSLIPPFLPLPAIYWIGINSSKHSFHCYCFCQKHLAEICVAFCQIQREERGGGGVQKFGLMGGGGGGGR